MPRRCPVPRACSGGGSWTFVAAAGCRWRKRQPSVASSWPNWRLRGLEALTNHFVAPSDACPHLACAVFGVKKLADDKQSASLLLADDYVLLGHRFTPLVAPFPTVGAAVGRQRCQQPEDRAPHG